MLSATSTVEIPTCAHDSGTQAIVNAAEAYHRWRTSATANRRRTAYERVALTIAATPGNSAPSSNSREAPPPVEM